MAKHKQKMWLVGAVLLFGLIVYAKMSPTFSTPFGSISGGDSQNNAYAITVTPLSGQICSVLFHSSFGDLQKTFNPCIFSGKFAAENAKVAINSVDLGVKEARVSMRPMWQPTCPAISCNTNFWDSPTYRANGFMFSDYPGDDIDWALTSTVDGSLVSDEVTDAFKCLSYPVAGGQPGCAYAVNGLRSDGYYAGSSLGVRVVDKSNTFQLTFGSINAESRDRAKTFAGNIPFTFEIVNPSFYAREELARRTIPSSPHYRAVDCPVFDNYTILTKTFSSGSVVSMAGLQYPLNYVCADMPMLVLDTNNNVVGSSTSQLQGLIAEQIYVVPAGEVWRLDYVAKANYQLGLICKKTNVSANQDGSCPDGGIYVGGGQCEVQPKYDVDKGGCSTTAGIISLACDGQFLESIHACVTQPENHCPPGSMGEYDAVGQLTCYTYKAVEERLVPGAIYNVDKNRWEYMRLPEGSCTLENSTYSLALDSCQRPRPLAPECNAVQGERLEVAP